MEALLQAAPGLQLSASVGLSPPLTCHPRPSPPRDALPPQRLSLGAPTHPSRGSSVVISAERASCLFLREHQDQQYLPWPFGHIAVIGSITHILRAPLCLSDSHIGS